MHAVYYRDEHGYEPVEDYLAHLPAEHAEAIYIAIDRLNRLLPADPPLPFPHSSQVDGPLRELRCHYGRRLYRVLYQRSDNLFVLLHILEKRSAELPEGDKATAKERWDSFKARMDAAPRRPPRPAGRDAP